MAKRTKPSPPSQAKIRAQLLKERQRSERLYTQRIKRLDQRRLKRDNELRKELAKLERTGLYVPKDRTLTKYRRSRIRKTVKEYGQYLNVKTFFFVPVKAPLRKTLLKNAKELAMQTTRLGMFVPHNGHTSVILRRSKSKRGKYELSRKGRVKRGPERGKVYQDIIPLEPLDEIVSEKQRLLNIGASLGPLGKNEKLAFRVIDHSGEGMSHFLYSNIDVLLRSLERYLNNRSLGAGLYFLRHIIIEKTTTIEWRTESKDRGLGTYRKKRRKKIDHRKNP